MAFAVGTSPSKFPENVLTKELVESWCARRDEEKIATQGVRILFVKQFGRFMGSHGYQAYITPLKAQSSATCKYVPHIFSYSELAAIFHEADKMNFSTRSPMRHLVVPLIFRLLYGCGMRVSEALKLTMKDIDLDAGILHIRNTKFYKERKIVMSMTLIHRCRDYCKTVHKNSEPGAALFTCKDERAYSYRAIQAIFNALIRRAGIPYGGRGIGPRIHDLRHTFAVHRLRDWTLNHENLSVMLPVLSTYLGHSDINATQYYLKLTADLYPHIQNTLNAVYGHIIPERKSDCNEIQ
jgi:integrase